LTEHIHAAFLSVGIHHVEGRLVLPVLHIIPYDESASSVVTVRNGVSESILTTGYAGILHHKSEFASENHKLVVADVGKVKADGACGLPGSGG
jgi:hypothetical protein